MGLFGPTQGFGGLFWGLLGPFRRAQRPILGPVGPIQRLEAYFGAFWAHPGGLGGLFWGLLGPSRGAHRPILGPIQEAWRPSGPIQGGFEAYFGAFRAHPGGSEAYFGAFSESVTILVTLQVLSAFCRSYCIVLFWTVCCS